MRSSLTRVTGRAAQRPHPAARLRVACVSHCARARRHPARRALHVCLAGPDQSQQPSDHFHASPEVSNDPAEVLSACVECVRAGDLDALLEFVPDELLDRVIAWRKSTGRSRTPLRFQDVLQANSQAPAFLDTYALRNLIFAAPASMHLLSAMRLGRDRYMQRCAIVAPSGEECVLTFALVRQESLEAQYRSAPVVSKRWMLASVSGESPSNELPAHPSPSFPPEAVVEAQLQALRERRVASIFAHASPENKAATGPVERFSAMLHSQRYAPLIDFVSADPVRRLQPSENTYMEVVRVTPRAGPPLLYMWIVSRQGQGSNWQRCWMVDAVQLLGDKLPLQVQP